METDMMKPFTDAWIIETKTCLLIEVAKEREKNSSKLHKLKKQY